MPVEFLSDNRLGIIQELNWACDEDSCRILSRGQTK